MVDQTSLPPANDTTAPDEPFPPPPIFLHDKVIEWDRALSLTPPWHWAILHMGKRIENRGKWTNCNYRGPIWLHAAKGIGTKDDFSETVSGLRRILRVAYGDVGPSVFETMVKAGQVVNQKDDWIPGPALTRGAVVGRAWISATVRNQGTKDGDIPVDEIGPPAHNRMLTADERAWWFGGFALYLDRVELLKEPVVCPGEQKIFKLEPEVAQACLRQLPARLVPPDGPTRER